MTKFKHNIEIDGTISADNITNSNTGDENTASIQSKRPLKTVGSTTLEGAGDIPIPSETNAVLREVTYATSVTDVYDSSQPNFYIDLTGDITLNVSTITSGGGIVNLNRSTGSEVITLTGTLEGNHTYPTGATDVIRLVYSYEQGELVWYCLNFLSAGGTTINNTLTSTATDEALSAAQGKVLKDAQDTQATSIGTNETDITALEDGKADKSNVLELDNTTAFTPDADYEPATKKYVDDNAGGGIDTSLKTVTFANTINESYDANRPNLYVAMTSYLTFNLTGTSVGAKGEVHFYRDTGGETQDLFTNGTQAIDQNFADASGATTILRYVHTASGLTWYNTNPPAYQSFSGANQVILRGIRYYNYASPLVNTYDYTVANVKGNAVTYILVYANGEISVRSATALTAGNFIVGRQYRIFTAGTTDFTLIGAADNSFGTVFTATGVGTGTGTAKIAYRKLGRSEAWQNNTNMIVRIESSPDGNATYELMKY